MPVIDTSFLVALTNLDDTHHAQARRLSDRPGPFIVPSIILHEFVSSVGRRSARLFGRAKGRSAAREAFAQIVSQPLFHIETDLDMDAVHQIFLGQEKLTLADAVAAAVARARREELLTFDKEQRAAARRR